MKVGASEIGAGFGYVLYSNALPRAVVCITDFAMMVEWTKYPLGCSELSSAAGNKTKYFFYLN